MNNKYKNYISVLRKIIISISIFIILIFNSGCWDSLDVNKKALYTAIILGKEDNQYTFWCEVAKLSGSSGRGGENGESKKFAIAVSHGETFAKARQDLEIQSPNLIYLGTVRIMGFTETMAKNGIEEYCYRMRNLQEYRKALNVIIIPDDVNSIFETNKNESMSVGQSAELLLAKLLKTGNVVYNTLSEVLESLSSKHKCLLLPNLVNDGGKLAIEGYSVIKNGVSVSFIPISDTKGIHYISNDNVITSYVVPFDGHTATVEVQLKGKKITPSYINNKVNFKIEFDLFTLVKYLDINDGLTPEYEEEIEKNLTELIFRDLEQTIRTSQTPPKSDYLKLHEYFRIKYPNEFKNMDWEDEYADASFTFIINTDLVPGREYDYNPDVKWKGNNDE